MYFTCDKDLIDDFHLKSGHSVGSKKSYKTAFNKYTAFHNMSLSDLLAEAITEQENNIPENRLSIYDRIISFRDYLLENHIGNTIQSSVSKIKTFYHYNRVKIPFIPPLNSKYVTKHDLISFEDLPDKDELRLALDFADDDLKMWILVILSSGASRCEAKSMTNRTLFEGTRSYHKKDNFRDALKDGVLLNMDLVDELHGRGKNKTREAYYKDNPEYLKLEYIKVMSNLSLYRCYEYKISNDKVKVISKPL